LYIIVLKNLLTLNPFATVDPEAEDGFSTAMATEQIPARMSKKDPPFMANPFSTVVHVAYQICVEAKKPVTRIALAKQQSNRNNILHLYYV
jgi:hypothetical protein